jgi:hypothetical protein
VNIGSLPTGFHVYKVVPVSSGFEFYVDGVLMTTINASFPASTPLKIAFSAYSVTSQQSLKLQADWVRWTGGVYTSAVFDAGQQAYWGNATWNASLPAGTSILIQTRSGSTSTPDGSWSNWTSVSNGTDVASADSRYVQYRAILVSSDPLLTPILSDFSLVWNN